MDLDSDGKLDILSGSWPGELYVFRGLGAGRFAAGETIKSKAEQPIKLGNASTVFAADWNGDGKLDLLIGDQQGRVHLMLNEGSAKQYAFSDSKLLEADDKRIQVSHGDSHPIAVDWDGDKKLDLIVGCGDGSVLFFKNVSRDNQPKLAKAEALVPPTKNTYNGTANELVCGSRTKVCVYDWNNDGGPDLLVGDLCYTKTDAGNITAEEKKAIDEAKAKLPELQKTYRAAYQEWFAASQPPRKDETPEEEAARKEKLEAAQEKLQEHQKELQEPRQAYSKLLILQREGKLTKEQEQELETVRKKYEAASKAYQEFVRNEYQPFTQPPLASETPEEAKARQEKAKPLLERMQKAATAMNEASQLAYKYERPQYAGAVWLFARKMDGGKRTP